jgi:hypothetical protein
MKKDPGLAFLTLTVDADAPEPLEPAGHAVGVDLGVKDFAVTARVRFHTTRTQPNVRVSTACCCWSGYARHRYAVLIPKVSHI